MTDRAVPFRVGEGADVHALVPGRPLVLGGVDIPFERGLEGHSDADVLCHAVCNAVLGGAGLGDLGRHFGENDPAWKDATGAALLGRVREKIAARGLRVCQVDATVLAQAPRIGPHTEKMSAYIAEALGIAPEMVNVKAATTEKLGFVGRGEGMEARAVVLLALEDAG